MRNIYYLFWVDSILRFKKFNPNQDWKLKVFIMNTWINALNFWTILIWLKFFKIYEIPSFTIDIFPGHLLNSFLGFVIIFALPFAVINYFLIFRNNRYLMLIKKYDTIKTPYALIYCFSIIVLAFLSAMLVDALR